MTAATPEQQAAADEKQFQTLRARLAIKGHQLFRVGEPNEAPKFFVSRWSLYTEIRGGLAGVRQWAERAGA